MIFNRTWASPNADTFSIPPIEKFVRSYFRGSKVSVDPFARNKRWATHTNDLNPKTTAEHHLDAEVFAKMLVNQGVVADLVLFDPPYSPRQISECYQSIGREVTTKDTQNSALYRRVRDALARLCVCVTPWFCLSDGTQWGWGKSTGSRLSKFYSCAMAAHTTTRSALQSAASSQRWL
jgi:hypothetical protein